MNTPSNEPRLFGHRYPWKTWFAAKTFTLKTGVDFAGRVDTMAQTVRNAASRKGLACSVRIAPDGQSLTATVRKRRKA